MLKVFIIVLLFFLAIAPALTLLHELGHAAIPVLKGQNTSIEVGHLRFIKLSFRNLSIEVGFLKPWIGFTRWQDNSVLPLIGGPLVSIILAILFISIGTKESSIFGSRLLFACAGWCFFQFVFTILPMTYPIWFGYGQDVASDGKQILEAILGRR